MQLTTFTPATESYVWSDRPRNTMKVKRRFIESVRSSLDTTPSEISSNDTINVQEDESRLFFDKNSATQVR